MGFFSKLFRKKREYEPLEELEVDFEWEKGQNLDLSNPNKRFHYVKSCLEQMDEASGEIERLQNEYQLVNSYLHDMEEIEALPDAEKQKVEEHAKAIFVLNGDKKQANERTIHMSESEFRKMERLEDEVEEGIQKLSEAEQYQEKIRKDLQRLEGEKHACMFRMEEAKISQLNMRGMTIISLIAAVSCVLILLILQFMLNMETQIGYMILSVGIALLLTIFFVKFNEARQELISASKSYNKVIALQNKVKIRYVNNTSLLDYYYIKYGVSSGEKLKDLWSKYQLEKEERRRLMETEADLDFHSEQLVRQLKHYPLFDPLIWVHQTEALLNPKEMVEIRHNLILRRQNLRKQMEYNNETAEKVKDAIMDVVKQYPKDAEEILKMVSEYEKKEKKYQNSDD
ncbi:MAG: hypothetical protein IIX48_02140 [Lachnospiraceae bacterium]|nr:hypothetical protein [Lachnospiraceae bacterium]